MNTDNFRKKAIDFVNKVAGKEIIKADASPQEISDAMENFTLSSTEFEQVTASVTSLEEKVNNLPPAMTEERVTELVTEAITTAVSDLNIEDKVSAVKTELETAVADLKTEVTGEITTLKNVASGKGNDGNPPLNTDGKKGEEGEEGKGKEIKLDMNEMAVSNGFNSFM